jgi:hypothetical protein
VTPPYRATKDATHIVAEVSKLPRATLDFAALAAANVAVVAPFYINEYMISDPPPKVDDFIIDEYKIFWEKRKRV